MKNFLFILLVLSTFLPIFGQEMSPAISCYRDGCLKMAHAIEAKDKYLMYDAKELFAKLSLSSFDDVVPADDITKQTEKAPMIYFVPSFADSLLLYDFVLVDLDPASILRKGDNNDLILMHRTVPARTTLTYRTIGVGDCEMMLFTMPGGNLRLEVSDVSAGKSCSGEISYGGCVSWAKWFMPQIGDILFKIENLNDNDATFVVAVNPN